MFHSKKRAGLARALASPPFDDAAYDAIGVLIGDLIGWVGEEDDASPLNDAELVETIIEHARALMSGDLTRPVALLHLATLLAARVPAPHPARAGLKLLLEGDAWRWYALALLRCGRCREAKRAALESMRFYHQPVVRPHIHAQFALLEVTYGQILCLGGDAARGEQMILRAAEHLRYLGETHFFCAAKTAYGGMLIERQRWIEALEVLMETADIAQGIGDRPVVVAAIYNAGCCFIMTGGKGAEACSATSMALLQELSMDSELPRAGWLRAMLMWRQGKVNEAISELHKIRATYRAEGSPIVGAQFSLPLVEALVEAKRYSEALLVGSADVELLASAGLTLEETRLRSLLEQCPELAGA
jgi:tetratricopeptide (TPR) repeat protein